MENRIYKYLSSDIVDELLSRWDEKHRFYHTRNHLYDILNELNEFDRNSEFELDVMVISAVFHDIFYNPKKFNNEKKIS
jgi:predicted metal-dependent HD superfamily phosphohydrolase